MSITFTKVSYQYSPNTVMAFMALKNVDLSIETGKITAIIGATGSGKTTLVQHLNALLLPSSGTIQINDRLIEAHKKPKHLKELRKQVGLVFQFPEYQLFEETIEKDLCFGPLNFGKSPEEASMIARHCLRLVNVNQSYLQRSPLDISGGEKRRIAIAGILAIEPDVLVLDEPTAGLDPAGAKEMMDLFQELNRHYKKTIIIVSHDFDNVVTNCDRIVVMDKGEILYHDTMQALFSDDDKLNEFNIFPPALIRLQQELIAHGIKLKRRYFTEAELIKALMEIRQ